MLRIAICDDEADARDALRFQLEKALMEKSEEIVYEFSAGSNAVSWLGKHPGEVDLLFLDIEMKGLNGMETAKQIRTFDEQIMIVFLTGYSEFVFEGYSVGALDYMLKPVTAQKLMEVLCRVRTRLEQEEDKAFSFKNADGTWRFLLQDILCFCSDKRIVTLVTGNLPRLSFTNSLNLCKSMRFLLYNAKCIVPKTFYNASCKRSANPFDCS